MRPMTDGTDHDHGVSTPRGEAVAVPVRAIRRAYQSPVGYGGVERFTVTDIHEFARRLAAEGVRALEDGA
jgi:hypothetical protein